MNLYQVLGVAEDASPQEIKTAYHNLIKAFHPDYYRGSDIEFSKQKTREIIEAFAVLRDPERRKEYDDTLVRNAFGAKYSAQYYSNTRTEEENPSTHKNTSQEKQPKTANSSTKTQNQHESDTVTPSHNPGSNQSKLAVLIAIIAVIVFFAANEQYNFLGFTFSSTGAIKNCPMIGEWQYVETLILDENQNTVASEFDSIDISATISLKEDASYQLVFMDTYCEGKWTLDDGGEVKLETFNTLEKDEPYLQTFFLNSKYVSEEDSLWFGFAEDGVYYIFVFERV